MSENYRVTSVGLTPAEDRARRMRFYFIAMSIRVACVASLFFVRGWWILLVAIGAALLPYLAVVVGNQASNLDERRPEAPEPLALTGVESDVSDGAEPRTIVVDVPVHRRSDAPGPEDSRTTPSGADAHDASNETSNSDDHATPPADRDGLTESEVA